MPRFDLRSARERNGTSPTDAARGDARGRVAAVLAPPMRESRPDTVQLPSTVAGAGGEADGTASAAAARRAARRVRRATGFLRRLYAPFAASSFSAPSSPATLADAHRHGRGASGGAVGAARLPNMAPDHYLITGRTGTGVHDRLDIEDLQREPRQFTLFVLAFLALQGRGDAFEGLVVPPAARFAELAAIHGLPFTEWIGDHTSSDADYDPKDPKDSQPFPSRFGGYCSHGSVAFPTWHRPCIMSIEQAIGDVAVQLAERLSANSSSEEAAQWKDAARALRFPFWDWAAEKVATNGVPKVITDEKVSIAMPGGVVKEVENPLAYYPFDTIPEGFRDEVFDVKAYFSQWKRTFRYVQSTTQPDGNGNASMNAEIKKRAASIRQGVGRLFTYDDKGKPALVWDEFSNHTTQSLRKEDYYNINSLEGVHDGLHGFIGGNGHMSFPDYAGFDPVFYLHHCNIDRLFALWEYVYPQYYMGKGYPSDGDTIPFTQSLGTYNLVYNAVLDGKTALAPYRTENSEYWTSDETRFLDGKYYSYPEVAGVKIGRDITDQQRIEARKSLQKHYGVHDEVPSLAGQSRGFGASSCRCSTRSVLLP
ncbi:tyrosinase family protein [Phanerochaete sordida]|uniref:tyrosinase n=1 Tax=Phanerochaete sordida TaxID=48140 RepID=A0A9P3G846_9APHY|nr:tyrosinase family protein [Phanerochaete sordida]